MIENYPFVQCLNPKYIVNKYTKDSLVVPCGKCETCSNQKSSLASLKVKVETLSNKFCRFVTLTYSNEYVPRMQVSNIISIPDSDLVCYEFDDFINKEYITSCLMKDSDLALLYNKTGLSNELHYLRKRDLQLFIKRLRKYLTKYSNEKIRYYAVGEYGPVHFRPHFHLLLWFSERETEENIYNCICKAWPFGRIDYQIPSNAASYVAGYLNGSCHLPSIFRSCKCKPFSCHSFFLGEKFLQKSKEEVYSMSAKEFNERSIPLDGASKSVHVWRSLKTYYYPKSHGFATSDYDSLIRTYRIYKEVTDSLNLKYNSKPYVLAREITRYINGHYERINANPHDYPYFITYFLSKYCFDYLHRDPLNYKRFERQLYFELKISRHFLRNLCNNDSVEETKRLLNKIINYYKECDYDNLTNMYDSQIQLVYIGFDVDDLCYFYDNSYDSESKLYSLTRKQIYKQFKEKSINVYNYNVKKKKLNDVNKLLYNF